MSQLRAGFQGVAISWLKRAAFTVLAATRWNGLMSRRNWLPDQSSKNLCRFVARVLGIPNRRRKNESRRRLHRFPRQIARLLGAEEAARELIYHRWRRRTLGVGNSLGRLQSRSEPGHPNLLRPQAMIYFIVGKFVASKILKRGYASTETSL